MTLGNRDLSNLRLPTGWDTAQLNALALQDGTTYATVAGLLNSAVGGLNNLFTNDPIFNTILSFTNEPIVQYSVGGADAAERHTEYGRPDAHRADLEGHMLPLDAWDRGLGWTWDYLRKANMRQVEADIAMAIQSFRNRWQIELFNRLFRRADVTGASVGLGAGGISPGFATAAANTGVDFVPPSWGGTDFTSAHEHYVAIAGGAPTAAVFADIEAELAEHGHLAPYDAWISPLDAPAVRLLTGFYPIGSPLVSYGTNAAFANLDDNVDELNGSYYIGVIGNVRIRVMPRIPQHYIFGFKSYGARSSRNPLVIRLGAGATSPNVIAMTDPRAGNATTPLQYMMLFFEFGVGIGADRTVATPRFNNGASWVDPTIV
jgi:hypothetical protein